MQDLCMMYLIHDASHVGPLLSVYVPTDILMIQSSWRMSCCWNFLKLFFTYTKTKQKHVCTICLRKLSSIIRLLIIIVFCRTLPLKCFQLFSPQIEKFMPLNNQLNTPDNRHMTPKIKSFKNQLTPLSTKKQLNFDHGSTVQGSDFDNYEHLANYPMDDQGCYAKLNNQIATPNNRLVTPKIASLKNQLGLPSVKKQLNFNRGSMIPGTDLDNYEHLAMRTLGDETQLGYTQRSTRFAMISFMTPNVQRINDLLTSPNMSIFSGSYCDILTPITDNSMNCTTGTKVQSSPTEYGLFPKPSRPIRGRHNKNGKISNISSSVERKTKN